MAAQPGKPTVHAGQFKRNRDPRTGRVPTAHCSIEGCESVALSRGWCAKHYRRWERHGDPLRVVLMTGPYRLLTTHDPARTLGEASEAGDVRYFATMIEAANALANTEAPFKTVIFDDGHQARDLTADEGRLLEAVCAKLGYDVEEVAG